MTCSPATSTGTCCSTDLERQVVTPAHLDLLADLLRGVSTASQEPLFLWAYDFSVVPTSLVSTTTELFYRKEVAGRATSTYYTPPDLVEFVLADVLRPDVLARSPVVRDPHAGQAPSSSGLSAHRAPRGRAQRQAALDSTASSCCSSASLAAISTSQRCVSRPLAFTSRSSTTIPARHPERRATPATYQPPGPGGGSHPASHRRRVLLSPRGRAVSRRQRSGGSPAVAGELVRRRHRQPTLERAAHSRQVHSQDLGQETRAAVWRPRPSQLFLWRTLDLLSEDGIAALLVSAKVLFNTRTTSKAFRARWLSDARLDRVINFSQVRHDFFEQAVAPFALIRFTHANAGPAHPIIYETARPCSRRDRRWRASSGPPRPTHGRSACVTQPRLSVEDLQRGRPSRRRPLGPPGTLRTPRRSAALQTEVSVRLPACEGQRASCS